MANPGKPGDAKLRAYPVVGGTAAGDGNQISGNGGVGINVQQNGATIRGNLIGVDAAGTGALGNGSVSVQITNASNTIVGGTSAGAANIIAFGASIRPV